MTFVVVVDNNFTILVVKRVFVRPDCESLEGHEVVNGVAMLLLEFDVLAVVIGRTARIVVWSDFHSYILVSHAVAEGAEGRNCHAEHLTTNMSVNDH